MGRVPRERFAYSGCRHSRHENRSQANNPSSGEQLGPRIRNLNGTESPCRQDMHRRAKDPEISIFSHPGPRQAWQSSFPGAALISGEEEPRLACSKGILAHWEAWMRISVGGEEDRMIKGFEIMWCICGRRIWHRHRLRIETRKRPSFSRSPVEVEARPMATQGNASCPTWFTQAG